MLLQHILKKQWLWYIRAKAGFRWEWKPNRLSIKLKYTVGSKLKGSEPEWSNQI